MMVALKRAVKAIFFGGFLALAGCSTYPGWLNMSGPSREQVLEDHDSGRIEGIALIDVDDALARKLSAAKKPGRFSDIFDDAPAKHDRVGPGDMIDIFVWETPPAMIFGASSPTSPAGPLTATSAHLVALPSQMVTPEGTITMPFAGRIPVTGQSTQQIEESIIKRLRGKANQPQVLVRLARNSASTITIVGDVNNSTLMPLTPKGERLLDALATGGGTKQAINRTAIQLSRGNTTAMMPLDAIIRDPRQNIALLPGDVVTALFQSQSFMVLGATGKNDEIPLEAQGISLAQALARSGGLNDARADARGVFVFRFEDAGVVDAGRLPKKPANGVVPVVYQIDFRDPAAFFVTQNFPVQDRDVIYVANAPAAEFAKFLRLLVSVALPAVSINNAVQ